MKYITNESYGDFNVSIPANKLLIGLPATQDAASDGYATPQDIKKTYQLCQKYNLKIRGLMSWGTPYDRQNNWQFANTYKQTWGI